MRNKTITAVGSIAVFLLSAMLSAFTKNEWAKPPNVYGFGPTFMLPTATDDGLGTGKWSAGPLAWLLNRKIFVTTYMQR
jgi:hypothetical protein